MSGVAVAGEATIGLVPRYLRAREHSATPVWAPAQNEAPQPARDLPETDPAPSRESGVMTMTEEMRKRIADATKPEKRRMKPMLFGVAAVAVIVVAILLFPDTVVALLPDPS